MIPCECLLAWRPTPLESAWLTTGKWKKQLLWILHRRPRRIWKRISADTWNSYLIKVQVTLFCQPSLSGRSLWTWLLNSRAFETPRRGIFLLECPGNRRTFCSVQRYHATTCGYMWILYSYRQVCGNLYLFIEEHTYSISSNYHLEICVETCGNPVAWALIIRHFCRPGKMQRKNSFLRQNKLVKLLKPKVQIKMLGQPVESRQESGHMFLVFYRLFKGYRPCRRPLFSIQRASMVRTMGLCDVMLRMAWRQSGHDEADKWLGELI